MNLLTDMNRFITQLKTSEGASFEVDESALIAEFEHNNTETTSWAVKLLTVIGTFFAICAFVAFMFVSELFKSEASLVLFGVIFILIAVGLHRISDSLLMDTTCISLYVLGFTMLGAGLLSFKWNENQLAFLFLGIAALSLFFVRRYLLALLAFLIIGQAKFYLFYDNMKGDTSVNAIFMVGCILIFSFLVLNEAKILAWHRKMTIYYQPARTATYLLILFHLFFNHYTVYSVTAVWWIFLLPNLLASLVILYLITQILQRLQVTERLHQVVVYGVAVVILALTVQAPIFTIALFLLLLCFSANYTFGGALAIIAFIYGVSNYYYDLDLSFLQKSGVLMASGLLFLLLYFLTKNALDTHEKL